MVSQGKTEFSQLYLEIHSAKLIFVTVSLRELFTLNKSGIENKQDQRTMKKIASISFLLDENLPQV